MNICKVLAKCGKFTPQQVKVAVATAHTMWYCCGSCDKAVKKSRHCEPNPDLDECCACVNATFHKIYGDTDNGNNTRNC